MPLSRITGVSPRVVAEYARNLRASGVWTPDGKTAGQWDDEESGLLAFWLDVWVGQGLLERSRAEDASGPATVETSPVAQDGQQPEEERHRP